jgi:ribose transport system ATP-binding protein
VRLQVQGIHKRFGATHALQGVDLSVQVGEIHAVIGENGAGKSTLMKILSGASAPDQGEVFLDGQRFQPRSPQQARECGIAMIYQELNLAPHLSVEENMVLGAEPSCFGWINRRKRRDSARAALTQLDYAYLPLEQPIHQRTPAEMQISSWMSPPAASLSGTRSACSKSSATFVRVASALFTSVTSSRSANVCVIDTPSFAMAKPSARE